MTPEEVQALFTRSDGTYAFARWGRPLAPIVFGVKDRTIATVKGAWEAMSALSGHPMTERDPELGANAMMFFLRDWIELMRVPGLDQVIPDIGALVERLQEADANQYRFFRFEPDGGIRAAFVFLRMDAHLSSVPAEALALAQVAQTMLLWSDTAFRDRGPLAKSGGTTILRPDVAGVIRAAYEPAMPVASQDASHALRLHARIARGTN